MAKLDFETNYFIITSYGEYLLCRGNAVPVAQFQHSHPPRVLILLQGKAAQAEQGESKEQARQGVIIDSLLLKWKHRDFAQIP